MKHGRGIKIFLLIIVILLVTLLVAVWIMFGTKIQAAMTIGLLSVGLWSMEYRGDYGFDEFLSKGGASSDLEMGNYLA